MSGQEIGVNIMEYREKTGLTTTELASRIGISQAQVSRLESGKRRLKFEVAEKMANVFSVKAEDILGVAI